MFIIDLCSPSLCDVELSVDLIQKGWVSCFSNPLKHTLELLLQVRLEFALGPNKNLWMNKQ